MLQQTNPRPLELLPSRPRGSHSSTFRKVQVLTNHYQVKLKPLEKIVIFRFKITPMIAYDNRQLRSQIMQKSLPELQKTIRNPVISGMCLYSTQQAKSKEWVVTCDNYTIDIKQVKIYEVRANPKVLLHFLNNGLRNVMNKLGYVQIGKTGKYFNTKNKVNIDNLFMYSGYRSNFVYLQGGFFLRVDAAKKIVRSQTVLQFIDKHYTRNQGKDKQDLRNQLKGELVDKIVMTNYGKTCYYKIIDICFKKLEEVSIEKNNMSIKDYYQQKYKINIKNNNQPLLQVQVKNKRSAEQTPCLLVPQLCLMTGIPDDFDEFRRKKISEATIKDPVDKLKEIQGLMAELKKESQIKQLSQLGIDISHQLSKITAKAIPVPRLALGKENAVQQGKEAFFNLFNKPIFSSKHDIVCGIIALRGTDLKPLINTFQSTSRNLAVNLNLKTYEMQPGAGIKQIQNQLTRAGQWGANICCIVVNNNQKALYKQIKQISLSKQEMITQVVTQFTLRKKNIQSIATKVLLQIIAKRGNTLWVPRTTFELSHTMLVAFDSAKGAKGTVLSVCATINSTFSSVYSGHQVCEQDTKFKIMTSLTLSCANAYLQRNKEYPRQILIYLNSCTGDQVSIYQQLFTKPLIDQLKSIKDQQHIIKVTVIMVNTKNSERFFTTGQPRNVGAGTLIAENLVSDNYDFFLVSQQSNRGSTVPNHYKVIFTTSEMQEGILQELSFSQCFNYVNWTGSIKVPAILQYAKKCAKFNAEVVEDKVVAESLHNKLYFV